ncbi:MAG: T9SS type A sorting domain-containing protein [Chitinophagaceae bacterium]|nr:T9SS type A sorting domain-containing protein [Chitinophagaceae bacterium]
MPLLLPHLVYVHQSTYNGGDDAMLVKMNPADSCMDQYEPNNTNLIATELSISSDTMFYGITGNISNSTDVDWFRIKTSLTNLKLELIDLVTDYDLYLYKGNGQLIATAANIGDADETIIFNSLPKGKYYVRVVAADNSYDPNACYRLRALIASQPWLTKEGLLENAFNQSAVQVYTYPNPAKDILSLKITAPNESTANVSIFEVSGQTILEKVFTIEEGSQTITLDVAALKRGMYLVATDINGVRSFSKIVLQ